MITQTAKLCEYHGRYSGSGVSIHVTVVGAAADSGGRLWSPDKSMGWNFTRSIGDVTGKQCGLSPEPEMKVMNVCQSCTVV